MRMQAKKMEVASLRSQDDKKKSIEIKLAKVKERLKGRLVNFY